MMVSYQLLPDAGGTVIRLPDRSCIPSSPGNIDRKAYDAWVAQGNTAIQSGFTLWDNDNTNWQTTLTYRAPVEARAVRSPAINPAIKTLVLISVGQSLACAVVPTLNPPTNSSAVDNFNVYNGKLYDCAGPLLGCEYPNQLGTMPSFGPGNILCGLADKLIARGWNRIILVPLAIGSTTIAQWATGVHSDRVAVAMARLSSVGITPSSPGVTFACLLMQGNQDLINGTSQAAWAASCQTFITKLYSTGFAGRLFVCTESQIGQTSNAIRSAQATIPNGVNIFSGGDIDSSTIGSNDSAHPNNAGAVTMAAIIDTAMHASGAPF